MELQLYNTREEDDRLEIRPSLTGRLTGAATRFLIWSPIALAGLSLLFLPDYIGQYREEEPVIGLFWLVMGGLAAFIGLMGALMRFLRRDVWVVDAREEQLVFETLPLVGSPVQTAIELERVERVVVERGSFGSLSAIGLELRGHPDELLGRTRVGPEGLDKLADSLESFIERYDLDIETIRRDASE